MIDRSHGEEVRDPEERPVEYETLGLLGSNCGLTEPDDVAAVLPAVTRGTTSTPPLPSATPPLPTSNKPAPETED